MGFTEAPNPPWRDVVVWSAIVLRPSASEPFTIPCCPAGIWINLWAALPKAAEEKGNRIDVEKKGKV